VTSPRGAGILDGKRVAAEILAELRTRVAALRARGVTPKIAFLRVGDDPASEVYVRTKRRTAEGLGIASDDRHLPATAGPGEIGAALEAWNADPSVHGILLQLPLPGGLDAPSLLARIDPEKDVDGFHPMNAGRLALGLEGFVPATPLGVRVLLERSGVDLEGRLVVIVGRSSIVGRPLANLLSLRRRGLNATVVLCHSGTRDLPSLTRQAEILVAAAGKPRLIRGSMIRPGAVVVDVGVNRVPDESPKGYHIEGDVCFEEAARVAGAITPVPGGVGPMTVAMLHANTLRAAERSCERASSPSPR
jgi:methylenetetrahydrofolate dehydrogenase (NADP+)/methenyltetrahydrofolate cyclohydrolase